MGVVVAAGEKTLAVERRDHGPARIEAVHSPERRGRALVHRRALGHDVEDLEAGAPGDLEVVGVVGGRDLDHSRAELGAHVPVGDDGDRAAREGKLRRGADEGAVAGVAGVHGHAGVAQHGLGPGGGHGQVPAAVRELPHGLGTGRAGRRGALLVAGRERIADVPERPVRLGTLGLLVGQGGEAARAPVDHVLAAIDEVIFVKSYEYFSYGLRQSFVEGEPGPGPVAAAADRLELPQDTPARQVDMLPDALQEGFAAQVVAGLPLLGQPPLDHVLGRDARVVCSGNPERDPSLHPPPADEYILDGVVEGRAPCAARR